MIPAGEVRADDLVVLGRGAVVEGVLAGTLVAVGGSVRVAGRVEKDVIAFGGDVRRGGGSPGPRGPPRRRRRGPYARRNRPVPVGGRVLTVPLFGDPAALALGLALLGLLSLVPVAGPVVWAVASLLGIGAALVAAARRASLRPAF